MRICNKCGQDKPLTDFHRNKSRPLGREYFCKECQKLKDKKREKRFYRDYSESTKKKIRLWKRRDYWINRHKYVAREMVKALVKTGEIKKQPCKCGNPKSMAHHPDYAKPLEVVWLCHKHHYEEHQKIKKII